MPGLGLYVPGPGIEPTTQVRALIGNQTRHLGVCPDQELNPQTFSYGTTPQSTEHSGQGYFPLLTKRAMILL